MVGKRWTNAAFDLRLIIHAAVTNSSFMILFIPLMEILAYELKILSTERLEKSFTFGILWVVN